MCHVLIIEDESLIAMNIQMLLEENGALSCDIAESQESALTAAFAHKPDFITADVTLLSGTGPLAVAAIVSLVGPVPVLFITGTPEACIDCPADQIVRKPMSEEAVVRAFHRLAAGALLQ